MIRADRDSDIWVLTLDRPDKANALTTEMLEELASYASDAHRERPAALILSGSGKVFSAGADLKAAKAGLATDPVWERLSGAIANLPTLTIAALNGTLAGGAFGMVLACDIRIAVTGSKFFYPVMSLGFLPQPSDPRRLADLVGPSRASMILMAGQKIEAPEALQWGLVDRIVEADELMGTARDLAAASQSATADHRAAIKTLIRG